MSSTLFESLLCLPASAPIVIPATSAITSTTPKARAYWYRREGLCEVTGGADCRCQPLAAGAYFVDAEVAAVGGRRDAALGRGFGDLG